MRAGMGPNQVRQYRTVLWLTSMLRLGCRSSTFLSDRGKPIHIMTTNRIILGLVLKWRKEEGSVIPKRRPSPLPGSGQVSFDVTVQTIQQTHWFSVRVGDMEDRLGTRRIEQENKRDENVAEMKGYVEARHAQINAAVQAKVDEI